MHDEKKQRTYIITGASSDVTIHFLERLGSQISDDRKIKIFAQYRTSSKTLQNLAARYHNLDMDIRQCDLSIEKDTERWITYIKEVCISDDIVPTHIVHLAAPKFSYMRIRQLEWERFTNGMDVSVRSFALLLKEFLPMMSKAKFGRIVAMLTAYTIGIPPKFMSDYVTIKYALLDARLSKRYAKFYTGKYYISIAFNRDFTVQFSSNYRVDGKFNRDLQRMEDRKFMINEVTDFIYFWMNKFRKM